MILSTLALAAPTLFATAAPQTPALTGLDPVALCEGRDRPGREGLELEHGRFTYRFADEASRSRFEAEPERYAIQWGGGCARMGPLSGAGDPDRWAVHAGHLYVFASDGCREGFLSAPERFAVPPAELVESADADTSEARAAGARWIERAVEAAGGAAAVDRAAGWRLGLESEQDGWHQELELLVASDGRLLRRSRWTPPAGDGAEAQALETSWILGERPGLVETRGDERSSFAVTSPDQLDDLRRHAQREPLTLLCARSRPDFEALHVGAGALDGHPVEDLRVRCDGLVTTLHLHPETGRVEGLSWNGRVTDGATRAVEERFTAWRVVEGVELPVERSVQVDGRETPSVAPAWTRVALEAELDPGTFAGALPGERAR